MSKKSAVIERCDRCGGRGHCTWTKGEQALTFCLIHNDQHELSILAAGFEPVLLDDEVLNPRVDEPEPETAAQK